MPPNVRNELGIVDAMFVAKEAYQKTLDVLNALDFLANYSCKLQVRFSDEYLPF